MSNLFGAVAATALTLIAVPLIYFECFKRKPCPLAGQTAEEITEETKELCNTDLIPD
ncbi:MAG: hypothetical protein ACYDAA_17665 [Syntrophales bacterium]